MNSRFLKHLPIFFLIIAVMAPMIFTILTHHSGAALLRHPGSDRGTAPQQAGKSVITKSLPDKEPLPAAGEKLAEKIFLFIALIAVPTLMIVWSLFILLRRSRMKPQASQPSKKVLLKCPSCAAGVSCHARFCEHCGIPLCHVKDAGPALPRCHVCGMVIGTDSHSCSNCGTRRADRERGITQASLSLCPLCRMPLKPISRLCARCGISLQ
ncbi:MAG: hypothetical protein RDV48_14410 [Candidatus Eremiobacteraeota bacterium]|nr:hypothetical protein [Candidatus Eremiobacteraeota bacterium]